MADGGKSRGSNFTGGELNQLCASWLHVSQDPIVGSAQKNGAFWDRTLVHYNDNRPKEKERRNTRSLESKWSELKRDVARFSGCYSAVVDAQHSGENDEDTIRRAKELYITKDPKAKEFTYVDQWILLKDCPRFAMTMGDLKQKAARNQARKPKGKRRNSIDKENDVPNAEGFLDGAGDDIGSNQRRQSGPNSNEVDGESNHFGECRPLGNKVAKRQRADESSTRMMAYAQKEMAEISAERLKLAKSQDLKDLFTIKVADLDEECQEYFKLCRAKELRIALAKLRREQEEEEQRAFRSATARVNHPGPRSPHIVPDLSGAQNVDDFTTQSTAEFVNPSRTDDFAEPEPNLAGVELSFTAQLIEIDREARQE